MFELDGPNGNFPFTTSSDNYNLIILPKGFDPRLGEDVQGTGPWKLEKYTPNVGVTYTKNPDYWDTSASRSPTATRSSTTSKETPQILGIQGGEVDLLAQFSAVNGKALLTDPNINVIELRASSTARCTCARTRSRSTTSACARRWRC